MPTGRWQVSTSANPQTPTSLGSMDSAWDSTEEYSRSGQTASQNSCYTKFISSVTFWKILSYPSVVEKSYLIQPQQPPKITKPRAPPKITKYLPPSLHNNWSVKCSHFVATVPILQVAYHCGCFCGVLKYRTFGDGEPFFCQGPFRYL